MRHYKRRKSNLSYATSLVSTSAATAAQPAAANAVNAVGQTAPRTYGQYFKNIGNATAKPLGKPVDTFVGGKVMGPGIGATVGVTKGMEQSQERQRIADELQENRYNRFRNYRPGNYDHLNW